MRNAGLSLFVAVALVAGCSSPKEKYAECQLKCVGLKMPMVQRICKGACEKKVYGEFDADKLGSLCDADDGVACLRFAVRAGASKADAVAKKLGACCDRKTALCCGSLGKMYSRGKILKTDKDKGYLLMGKACLLGDGTACASPGLALMGKKEYEEAKKLFEAGCAKDSKFACGLLGVIYRDGKGVERNVPEARKYLDKACKLGAKMSCKALTRLGS